MTEISPFDHYDQLPTPEVGDWGSFEREPEGGRDDAPPPELEDDEPNRPLADLIERVTPEPDDDEGGRE